MVWFSYPAALFQPQEANPISGQAEYEALETFFANVYLRDAERLVS